MSKREFANKLNVRDLINIGIYSAICFVIVMALAMTEFSCFCKRAQYFPDGTNYGQGYVEAV